MSNDGGGGRYDGDDKIIDITDFVNKKTDEEIEIEEFTNHFVNMFNRGIIERQREEARKQFINFMINFLLCSQIAITVAICFIIAKIY
tara:strand:- start:1164 stop:1427 length:264 start_codon:yes stop_codon:yes gene_type:complete